MDNQIASKHQVQTRRFEAIASFRTSIFDFATWFLRALKILTLFPIMLGVGFLIIFITFRLIGPTLFAIFDMLPLFLAETRSTLSTRPDSVIGEISAASHWAELYSSPIATSLSNAVIILFLNSFICSLIWFLFSRLVKFVDSQISTRKEIDTAL